MIDLDKVGTTCKLDSPGIVLGCGVMGCWVCEDCVYGFDIAVQLVVDVSRMCGQTTCCYPDNVQKARLELFLGSEVKRCPGGGGIKAIYTLSTLDESP